MAYPIPSDQLREIRELFDQCLPSADIADQFGIPPRSIIAQRAVYTWQKSQGPDGGTDSSVEDAITTTFGLEKDLQSALRGKIDQLEDGLEIIDGGKERTVKSGRIDITAKDRNGSIVVMLSTLRRARQAEMPSVRSCLIWAIWESRKRPQLEAF